MISILSHIFTFERESFTLGHVSTIIDTKVAIMIPIREVTDNNFNTSNKYYYQ